MNVNWTDTAIQHLVAIYEYIARDSTQYAQRMVDRITRRSIQIDTHPESGRAVPEFDHPQVRELFEGPYRIIYRMKSANQIDVLAVIHGARELPPLS